MRMTSVRNQLVDDHRMVDFAHVNEPMDLETVGVSPVANHFVSITRNKVRWTITIPHIHTLPCLMSRELPLFIACWSRKVEHVSLVPRTMSDVVDVTKVGINIFPLIDNLRPLDRVHLFERNVLHSFSARAGSQGDDSHGQETLNQFHVCWSECCPCPRLFSPKLKSKDDLSSQ